MNGGQRGASSFRNLGAATEGVENLFNRHAEGVYDNRISLATENTNLGLDAFAESRHSGNMRSAAEILEELKARKIPQRRIGEVLGIAQPNVAVFFTPDKRTQKVRALGYDEARSLIQAFDMEEWAGLPSTNTAVAKAEPPNADILEPLIDALLPLAPEPGRMTDQSRRALAEAFAYGLGLLDGHPSSPPSGDAVAVAARAAVSRFRDLMN